MLIFPHIYRIDKRLGEAQEKLRLYNLSRDNLMKCEGVKRAFHIKIKSRLVIIVKNTRSQGTKT